VKKKGKEKFLTPISHPLGEMGARKIFSQMEHYRARIQVKFQIPKVYVGWGEIFKKFSSFLEVKCAVQQISKTVGDINPLFAPGCWL